MFGCGSIITLAATPGPGWIAASWSGVSCPVAGKCTLWLEQARTVTLRFEPAGDLIFGNGFGQEALTVNSSDRFRRLESLFHELEALDPVQREQRLDAVSAEDPELHAELLEMIKPSDGVARDEAQLDRMAGKGGLAASLAESGDPPAVGPYTLIRELGEGGMGRVYMAEQSEPVRRTVALKLTRRGFDSAEAKVRFRAERQALAVLEHPNIARVFDAGSTDDGRPWFAMEYIEGLPITDWAEQRGLGLVERIRLLLTVCDAVQHAHRKGLIHRDLKPSNILVVDDGGLGFPKVIDFGISRAVGIEPDGRSKLTQLGELVGTPEYMSPEQAALGEIDIDTRSDVYSLGLVLYELLVGAPPISGRDLRALGFEAMCRHIREGETPRPSRFRAPSESQESTTARWRSNLKGDLDSVLLKALAKDRERRYGSAAELADDLKRYLDDQPVLAQPPSLAYRATKFVRRHRWPVAAAAAVSVAIVSGAVIAGYGLLEARAAQAESERQRVTAEESLRFMVGLFTAADPRESAGSNPTALELLGRGRERIDELEDAPLVRVRLLESLGEVYWSLGDLDVAREMLVEGIASHRVAGAIDSARLAQMLGRLGAVHRDLGELSEAERFNREALAELESAGLGDGLEAASNLNQLAIVLSRTGRLDAAVDAYRRALDISERLQTQSTGSSLITQQRINVLRANMAVAQYRKGDHRGAAESFERVLAIVKQELPPTHPYIGTLHNNLANAYEKLGHRAAVRRHAEKAVEIDRAGSGERHPTVADSLLKLGQAMGLLGEYDAAEAALIESRGIIVENRGAEHFQVAMRDFQLGMLSLRRNQPDVAARRFERAVARADETEGLAGMLRAGYRRNLALAYRGSGDRAAAERAAREALDLAAEDPAADGERTKAALLMALLAVDRGDNAQAEQWLDRAMEHDSCSAEDEASCIWVDNATMLPLRAAVLARLGRNESARAALAAAIEHSAWHVGMLADPDLEPLRRDVGWPEIEQQLRARIEADRRTDG